MPLHFVLLMKIISVLSRNIRVLFKLLLSIRLTKFLVVIALLMSSDLHRICIKLIWRIVENCKKFVDKSKCPIRGKRLYQREERDGQLLGRKRVAIATTVPETKQQALSVIFLENYQSINQSKFIFQAIRNNYNIINVTALERLPEKHYAH